MKRLKKILLLAVAMLLAAVISITATIAYLKSQTDVVQNAFAVGKIKISLDEAKVNENGQPVDENGNAVALEDAPRVLENSYTLVPGKTYVKDPTVHISEDSEPCLVFVVIYFPDVFNSFFYADIFAQLKANNKWGEIPIDKMQTDLTRDYRVFAYNGTVKGGEDITLFSTISVGNDVTRKVLETASLSQLKITAYAFQDEGTANWTYEAAWAKLVELCDPFNQDK